MPEISNDAPELATTDYWRGVMRRARQEHGLTQGQLAKLIGVSQSAISQLESGEMRQSKAILAICETLKIPPPQMLFEDEQEQRWVEAGRLLRARDENLFDVHLDLIESLIKKLSGSPTDH